jgi:hypothetical protein
VDSGKQVVGDPIIAQSALKHGLDEDQILHGARHRARHAGPREVPQVMTMPRTVEEILAHADELAERFENYEPSPGDELDPAVVALLRAAVAERSAAEKHLLEAVHAARNAGLSWSAIGNFVGTTGEAARQRYSARVA